MKSEAEIIYAHNQFVRFLENADLSAEGAAALENWLKILCWVLGHERRTGIFSEVLSAIHEHNREYEDMENTIQ